MKLRWAAQFGAGDASYVEIDCGEAENGNLETSEPVVA